MYVSDQVLGLNLQEILVDCTNTANVEFIVDPKVLFHG